MDVDEPHLLGEPRAGPGAVSGVAGDGHKTQERSDSFRDVHVSNHYMQASPLDDPDRGDNPTTRAIDEYIGINFPHGRGHGEELPHSHLCRK